MKNQIWFFILISITISCSFVDEISTYKELDENNENELQIVTCDTSIYYANSFTYSDTSLIIIGTKKKNDIIVDYHGELLFKDISYIETKNTYFFPTLAFIGMNIFLIANDGSLLLNSIGIEPYVKIIYPYGSSGSCPYVYSKNNNKFCLEGEAFGISLGKALESETTIILNNASPENDQIKIKLTNERPETHFFNNVKFSAIETDKNSKVYADNHNKLAVVQNNKSIKIAKDNYGKDITNLLINSDENYWESDLSNTTLENNFEDRIYIDLKPNQNIDSISLIISAINTEISNEVFKYLQQLLGKEFIDFTSALENDPEIISILKNTLKRSALKIDVWNGYSWEYCDLIYPEANHVKFNKLVRIPNIKCIDNIIKLRLRSLCDVWKIDAINFDDSFSRPIKIIHPKIKEFGCSVKANKSQLEKKDEEYIKLLPGDSITFSYDCISPSYNKKITYAVKIGGYLYEWIIDNNTSYQCNRNLAKLSSPKIKFVKKLLKNVDYILPIIYKNWETNKNNKHEIPLITRIGLK